MSEDSEAEFLSEDDHQTRARIAKIIERHTVTSPWTANTSEHDKCGYCGEKLHKFSLLPTETAKRFHAADKVMQWLREHSEIDIVIAEDESKITEMTGRFESLDSARRSTISMMDTLKSYGVEAVYSVFTRRVFPFRKKL